MVHVTASTVHEDPVPRERQNDEGKVAPSHESLREAMMPDPGASSAFIERIHTRVFFSADPTSRRKVRHTRYPDGVVPTAIPPQDPLACASRTLVVPWWGRAHGDPPLRIHLRPRFRHS